MTARYKSKPTDIACKGFEAAYYFTKLMLRYPGNVMSHLNDSSLKVFNDYNFRPVMLNKIAMFLTILKTSICM